MNLIPAIQLMVKGFILLAAVWIDIVTKTSRQRVKGA
jgi:ABC-type xylose transport system permease subunit